LVDVDSVVGGAFNDTLIGNNADNDLVGREGNDNLVGNGGDDLFSGQQGDDTYDGGRGSDTAEYYDQNFADGLIWGPMNVNLRTGIATGDGTDTLNSIENATGSSGADTMIGDAKANFFYWLYAGDDTVRAGGGNDTVNPGAGANVVFGGSGEDGLGLAAGTDPDHPHAAVTLDLATGTSSSGDTLQGFEDLSGSYHRDTLIGDSGPNTLSGDLGGDVLKGKAGDDNLVGMGGADEANGGAGTDRCRAETIANCES
jgi:Ca2+-binding RTX toxin-like protein